MLKFKLNHVSKRGSSAVGVWVKICGNETQIQVKHQTFSEKFEFEEYNTLWTRLQVGLLMPCVSCRSLLSWAHSHLACVLLLLPQTIMRDKWMNISYEDDDLKPYVEPQPDNSDPSRIGNPHGWCGLLSYLGTPGWAGARVDALHCYVHTTTQHDYNLRERRTRPCIIFGSTKIHSSIFFVLTTWDYIWCYAEMAWFTH